MKSILCPTDFSEQASHAVEAGYYLAKKFNANFHLLHVIESETEMDFNVGGASGMGGRGMDDIFFLELIDVTRKKMDELANTPELEGISVTSDIKVGNPFKFIFEEINSGKHDLILMGTKGVSGFKEILIGSNTEKIVRKSPIPVLSVKEYVAESIFMNIVYASSFNEDENELISRIKEIQEAFGATLHLVRINTPNNFQADWTTRRNMEEFVKRFKIRDYTFNIYNDAIEEDGIIYFAEETDAGMIAMATHGRTGFAHLLSGSIAEDVVNHAKRSVYTYNLNK